MEIIVNDATVNRAKVPKTSLPKEWETELHEAIDRLDLGPHTELKDEIVREAAAAKKDPSRIKIRAFFVERTPQGTVRMTRIR
jgi:hypothetical protein